MLGSLKKLIVPRSSLNSSSSSMGRHYLYLALLVLCLMGQATTRAVAAYTVADAERREPAVRAAVREYLRRAGRATAVGEEYVFVPLRPRAAGHLHDGDVDPGRHLSPAQVAAVVRKLAGRAGVRVGARSLRGAARAVSENG